MDKISLQGKCGIRNIQGQMVRISLQEEKQNLKHVITIWYLSPCKATTCSRDSDQLTHNNSSGASLDDNFSPMYA